MIVILEALPPMAVDLPALFIRGSESNYISDTDWSEIRERFPRAELSTILNAGHWLHADQPEEFYTLVRNFLIKNS